MSQEELARDTDLSIRTVAEIERANGTASPKGSTVRALAERLDIPFFDLWKEGAA